MASDRSIPTVFVNSDKSGAFTGATSFSDGRFTTEGSEPLTAIKGLRGGKTRSKALVIDTGSINSRSFNPYLTNCSRISGCDVWLMETIRNLDDLMDAFIGGMTKLVFPVHTMDRDFTLKDVATASDSCIPAILCAEGKPFGGGDLLDKVRETCTVDFPNVFVVDCDGSVDDGTWRSITTEHPGVCVFSPARSSLQIKRSHVLANCVNDYEPKVSSDEHEVKIKDGVKAVVFDIDGTMMLTRVDYSKLDRAAYDHLVSLGVPASELEEMNNTRSFLNGYAWLTENGRSDEIEAAEKAIGERLTEVEMENSAEAVAVPGIIECIKDLKSRGYKVGTLTRGGRVYAEHVLSEAGILELMDTVRARDDGRYTEGKPNRLAMERTASALGVEVEEILFIGDTSTDFKTSVASGCQFIGVTTGPITEEKWREIAGDDVNVLPSAADVCHIL